MWGEWEGVRVPLVPAPLHVHTEIETPWNWSIPHASVLRSRTESRTRLFRRLSLEHVPAQGISQYAGSYGDGELHVAAGRMWLQLPRVLLLCSAAGLARGLPSATPVSLRCWLGAGAAAWEPWPQAWPQAGWAMAMLPGSAVKGCCWAGSKTHLSMLVPKIPGTSYFLQF